MAHAGGRPTKYNPEVLIKFRAYLDSCVDSEREIMNADKLTTRLVVNLPSVPGLVLALAVDKSTIYEWAEIYPEFSHLYRELVSLQEQRLLANGLSNDYNANLSKFILSARHDYREKTETDVTTKGEKLPSANLDALAAAMTEKLRDQKTNAESTD